MFNVSSTIDKCLKFLGIISENNFRSEPKLLNKIHGWKNECTHSHTHTQKGSVQSLRTKAFKFCLS